MGDRFHTGKIDSVFLEILNLAIAVLRKKGHYSFNNVGLWPEYALFAS